MTTVPTRVLSDDHDLPALGLGTYSGTGDDPVPIVRSALDAGYRLIDTALRYGNEEGVGQAIRESEVPRNKIVLTTKVPGRYHGYDKALQSFDISRRNLGLHHVDLLLIHWPLPKVNEYVDTWRAFIKLREEGLVSSIGVSNFTEDHLTRLIEETGVTPVVNQIEMHPYFPQQSLRGFHDAHGIVTESWSPLGRGSALIAEKAIVAAAKAHEVSPAQVVLRWHVELAAVPLPRSGNAARQRENLDVFGFALSDDEIQAISALERGRIWDQDPNTYEEF